MEKLVIDGGPCAGKTTGLITIAEKLLEKGIIPIITPEAATLLIQSGVTSSNLGSISFQKSIVELQLKNEDYWSNISKQISKKYGKKSVLLTDRGLLTGSAYLSSDNQLEDFQKDILNSFKLNIENIRSRYLGVIHMVTAADGALEYYTLENNTARTETSEQAILLDQKTQKAWLGHSHLAVVGNKDKTGQKISFKQKIDRVVDETFRILGLPVPIELEDKFKLKRFDPSKLPVPFEKIDITQTYLHSKNQDTEERVRERNWMGYTSYFHTIKKPNPNGIGRFETEKNLSLKQYNKLFEHRNQRIWAIKKTRYCFVWNSQYFEVDTFSSPSHYGDLILMERERTDQNDTTHLPDFIEIEKDVTNEKKYSNFAIASS